MHKAHVLFEAAKKLGWSDAEEVAKLVRRIERGLTAEDELAVIFHWLGQCKLVHKLDQFPYPPGVYKRYRVPDLFAVFDVAGASVPVLIEVKTSTDGILRWKPEYLKALQAYADLMGLPLLVAWKYQTLWALFEVGHLRRLPKARTNVGISFVDAMRQTLLGLLAGDFHFSFLSGVGVHIKIRKIQETEGGFDGRVEDAYFLNANGEKHTGAGGVLQLFMCLDQEALVQEDDTHAVQSFVLLSDEQAEFAHRAVVTLLQTFVAAPNPLDWRQVLVRDQLSLLAISPQKAALHALNNGFIKHLIRIRPKTRPAFMANLSSSRAERREDGN